jgi:hypothetical protein
MEGARGGLSLGAAGEGPEGKSKYQASRHEHRLKSSEVGGMTVISCCLQHTTICDIAS